MAAAAGAAVAAATAGQDEDLPLPGPPIGRRAVCSRPYFVVLMVFAHLYVLNVLGLLLFVHISSDDGDPEQGKESPSPGQSPPALPFSPGGSSGSHHALPRLEGIKASTARARRVFAPSKQREREERCLTRVVLLRIGGTRARRRSSAGEGMGSVARCFRAGGDQEGGRFGRGFSFSSSVRDSLCLEQLRGERIRQVKLFLRCKCGGVGGGG